VSDITRGGICFLYQYDLKKLYGVWRAKTTCGWHEKDAWGGKYKNQVRVELMSDAIIDAPFSQAKHLIEHSGTLIYPVVSEAILVRVSWCELGTQGASCTQVLLIFTKQTILITLFLFLKQVYKLESRSVQ